MSFFLAICWTIAFLLNVISCVVGSEPTWLLVFAPLIIVVINAWQRVLDDPNLR